MPTFSLLPFEAAPAILKYTATWIPHGNSYYTLHFDLFGSTDAIDWGAPSAPGAYWGHELWRQTCFELFLGFPGIPNYWEWNFSPSGQVCCYKFSDYRQSQGLDLALKTEAGGRLQYRSERQAQEWWGNCLLNFAVDNQLAWALRNHRYAEINLTSVLKMRSGENSYWAPRHPAEKADFHSRSEWQRVRV